MAELTLTEDGKEFLRQWTSDSRYVTAHTSGSTGVPKEVLLPKDDMKQSARATNRFFGIDSRSLLVCPLSASYIAGKMMIVRALEADCQLVMEAPSNHPLQRKYGRIDLLPIVPSQIDGLLESEFRHDARHIIVGGAAMSVEQERKLQNINGILAYATYGMTETCSHVALREAGCREYQAMPGIMFDIDSRSCLRVKAPQFSFREITTNDIVTLIDDTHFIWNGRADNVVISGGIKIFPEEIERKLSGLIPYPFYFIGESDSKWGQRLVMKVELPQTDVAKSVEAELRAILEKHLTRYHLPKSIVFLSELPRTSNGKIRRL